MEIIEMITNELAENIDDSVDKLEARLLEGEQIEAPLEHVFTPGLYGRKIFMPKGSLIVSKRHKTRHQFVIMAGSAFVRVNANDWERLDAGYSGITEAGTRRVLFIIEDCLWMTFHPTDVVPENDSLEARVKAAAQVEEIIIDKRKNKNPYLNTINPNPCLSLQPEELS